MIQLLEAQRPTALLTVRHHCDGLERLIEDWKFLIPSATVIPRNHSTFALRGEPV